MKINNKMIVSIAFAAISLVTSNNSFCAAEKANTETKSLTKKLVEMHGDLAKIHAKNKAKEVLTLTDCKLFVQLYDQSLKLSAERQKIEDAAYQQKIAMSNSVSLFTEVVKTLIGKTNRDYTAYLEKIFGTLLTSCKAQIAQEGKQSQA